MARDFTVITSTLPGLLDPAVALAGARCGAIGLLDVEHARGDAARQAVARWPRRATGRLGLKVDASDEADALLFLERCAAPLDLIVLAQAGAGRVEPLVRAARDRHARVLVEVTNLEQADLAEAVGADGLVAKGHEAGGWVSDETTFILLQRLIGRARLPVWAHGGIGLHTAAACYTAGAAGVLLDTQLALVRESPLGHAARAVVARLDGSETLAITHGGRTCRFYYQPGCAAVDDLRRRAERAGDADGAVRAWRDDVRARIGWATPERHAWPLGQDVAFAAALAAAHRGVGGVVAAVKDAAASHVAAVHVSRPLDADAALARSHGTRFPIVQGPMTRVSDTAAFADAVSAGGALPFLALALMRAPEVTRLLDETAARLGDCPWGVGILGFVPPDLREEQLAVVRRYRPPFALIAGGRPDHARALEADGIQSYLHVPSPTLLRMFVESGARRFVFEGRECGGHVGPRSSFVLWDTMVDVLGAVPGDLADYHVLFAGGIHDARSAAMVATLAAPLAARGARVGVLLGTAYLFTEEVVASGAVVDGFQQEALRCGRTVLLETGPGHAIRCADTPFREQFEGEKKRLTETGHDADAARASLEQLNIGRLRIASKGITRQAGALGDPASSPFAEVPPDAQRRDGMYMIGQLAALRHERCTIAALHDGVSAGGSALLAEVEAAPRRVRAPARQRCDIAIVGMGCLLPKAPDLQTYWENILGRVDAITEVPRSRWDWRPYFDVDQKAPDKVMSRWGGFLEEVPFDPIRYGMPPSSLRSIEPLQLLLLEAVRMAIQDAGYADRPLPRERTAVIVGAGGGIADLGQQYAFRSALPRYFGDVPDEVLSHLPEWTEDTFPGLLVNVAAGRVANRFDLGGPNYTVDAACASSLAAVYLGVRELELGTSDVAIVGGADTMQNPFAYTCFSKTQALSPHGRCRPFDASADGIAISEGLAVLVLKRVEDAERDGDRVYAVLKGLAGASDGRGKGLTAPRVDGQVHALEGAYASAAVSPSTIGLIEAHGTGTVVGDQAEIEALTKVFSDSGASPQSCAIGSVKSMIGHTKCTAGMAALIKAALALHYRVVPPTIGVEHPNPRARFAESPFFVSTAATPWCDGASVHPRRAGVSAFGFGGTNFHAVLEEYAEDHVPAHDRAPLRRWPVEICVFTGRTPEELDSAAARVEQAITGGARPALLDLAFTLWQSAADRRPDAPVLAIVAETLDDLHQKLAAYRERWARRTGAVSDEPRGVYYGAQPIAQPVAVLFPGQGSQYPNMLRDLFLVFPELREHLETANRVLAPRMSAPLSSFVFPRPWFTPEEEQQTRQALMRTTVAQPALASVDLAAIHLLSSLGLDADMFAGHSFGEYAALHAAGSIAEEALYAIAEARGRLILDAVGDAPGGMVAVDADLDASRRALGSLGDAWISNLNAPSQTIVSGTTAGLAHAMEKFRVAGLHVTPVAAACAFHSPVVAGAREPIGAELRAAGLLAPRATVFSNTLAAPYPSSPEAIAELLVDHLTKPVDFRGEIEAMYAAGARVFVEAGPRGILTGLVRQTLEGRPHAAVSIDAPGRNGLVQLQHALAKLLAEGVPLRLDRLHAGRSANRLALDTLVPDTRARPLDPRMWLVTGGRARPAHEIDAPFEPVRVSSPPAPAPAPAGIPDPPLASPSLPAAASGDGVMAQYQGLMAQFLETQRRVMLAYLRGGSAATEHTAAPVAVVAAPVQRPDPPAPVGEPVHTDEAPPVAEVQPTTDRDALQRALLSLVQDRTGYPPDMLDLDADIEADLGIDSIKRVEILAAFQKSWLDDRHGSNVLDRLTASKTLRSILDVVCMVAAPPNDAPPRTRLVLQEIAAAPHPLHAHGALIVTDDETEATEEVIAAVRAAGAEVVRVRMSSHTGPSSGFDHANLVDPDAVATVVQAARRVPGGIAGVVHLLPLMAAPGLEELDLAAYRARCAADVKGLFNLAKAVREDLIGRGSDRMGWLFAATRGLHGDLVVDPSAGAVSGLMRTLAVELPQVRCRVLHVEETTAGPDVARCVLAELASADDEPVVCWRAGARYAPRPEPAPIADAPRRVAPMAAGSIVLVTGGARGITSDVTAEIAARSRPHLILVGRSPLPTDEEPEVTAAIASATALKAALLDLSRQRGETPTLAQVESVCTALLRARAIRASLRAFAQAGATWTYRQADVRDPEALTALVREAYRLHGRIDGVIHGAGVIEDKLFHDKSAASFDRVFDTKADSAFVLARELQPDTLKFLVFFSSVAGAFGSRGQCDYTAANGLLNAIAARLDARWSARVVAINWGPWRAPGMVSPEVERQFLVRGISLVDPAAGRLAFDQELRGGRKGEAEIIIGWGPWTASGVGVSDAPAASLQAAL